MLFTGVLAEEKTVPGDLQCKNLSASTALIWGSVLLSPLLLLSEYYPTCHQVPSHQGSHDMQKPCLYHDGCLHTEDGRHGKLLTASRRISDLKKKIKKKNRPSSSRSSTPSSLCNIYCNFFFYSCLVEKDMCCSLSLLGYHVTYPRRLQQHGHTATMGRAGISLEASSFNSEEVTSIQ